MSADPIRLDEVLVTERELWQDGPPHALFQQYLGETGHAADDRLVALFDELLDAESA